MNDDLLCEVFPRPDSRESETVDRDSSMHRDEQGCRAGCMEYVGLMLSMFFCQCSVHQFDAGAGCMGFMGLPLCLSDACAGVDALDV